MRIEFITKNYHLNENLKQLITKKLDKFDKYFDSEVKAKVKLSTINKGQNVMEINIDGANISFVRSLVTGENMNELIDKVLPKLERQIVKYRDKFDAKFKRSEKSVIYQENVSLKSQKPNVARVKKFDIALTTAENAIEEMELLNHNFYVFINADNKKVNIIYKRKDGDYGLIEPEY